MGLDGTDDANVVWAEFSLPIPNTERGATQEKQGTSGGGGGAGKSG